MLSLCTAGTYRLCREWDSVNPIFAEKDGGDESLRTGTSHGGQITLRALEDPSDEDEVEDDIEQVPDTDDGIRESPASTQVPRVPAPFINRLLSPSTPSTPARQAGTASDLGSEQETLSVRASEYQEQRCRHQAR